MSKAFASQADLEVKKVSFTKLSDNAYAYTAEGDPNTGIIIGDDAVMVLDTQATPVMAQDVIRRIREVTDKPIKYVVLTHYHAVRVLGASAYQPQQIIASQDTYDLIVERGEQDKASEIGRFPRLFNAVESVPPGMTWPTMTFTGKMTIWLGKLEVQLLQLGRGHTKGDTVAWLPQQKILFSGDLVEFDATPYAGDAYFADWPATLDRIAELRPSALVPGRGAALTTPEDVAKALAGTRSFIADVHESVKAGRGRRQGPECGLQGNLREAAPAVRPLGDLRPLHAVRRDALLRRGDRASRSAHLDRRARRRDVEDARGLRPTRHRREDQPVSHAHPTAAVDYQRIVFPYRRCADQDAEPPARHPVVVVGAGPVGLSLAIDLAQQGTPVVLLDNDDRLSSGSRAICFAKRTLEIFDRLGCGDPMVDKGVSWNVGKVHFRDQMVYQFDLLPEAGHERPAFINLQQYYVEGHLAERAAQLPLIDLRWKHAVVGATQDGDRVQLEVETPDGRYRIDADWVAACDGARSPLRGLLGLESHGRSFKDRFLIADVKMQAAFPPERWFWFDPPFHPNQSVLLHRQPDDVWRIDFQLGWDADPEVEKRPENIIPRVRALLGRGCRIRARMGERLHLRLPAHGQLLPRSGAVRRRLGARCLAVRRARRQLGRAGCRQPGLEAGACAARPGRAGSDRELRQRARIGGRREHPRLDPRHRLHHAEERDQPAVP